MKRARVAVINKRNAHVWGADSLAAVQPAKSDDWRDHFSCTPYKRHEHTWLFGTDNAVCSKCGLTVPKDKTHLYA